MITDNVIIIFGNDKNMFSKFLKNNFTHLDIIIANKLNKNKNIFISPRLRKLSFKIISDFVLKKILKKSKHNIKAYTNNTDISHIFGFYSCVSIAKKILGIQKIWLITPYQLYKHMVRTNTSDVYKYIIDN